MRVKLISHDVLINLLLCDIENDRAPLTGLPDWLGFVGYFIVLCRLSSLKLLKYLRNVQMNLNKNHQKNQGRCCGFFLIISYVDDTVILYFSSSFSMGTNSKLGGRNCFLFPCRDLSRTNVSNPNQSVSALLQDQAPGPWSMVCGPTSSPKQSKRTQTARAKSNDTV